MVVAFGSWDSDSLHFSIFSKLYTFYHCEKTEIHTHSTREYTILINIIIVNLSGDFCFDHLNICGFDQQ